jgi:hypothetical protein
MINETPAASSFSMIHLRTTNDINGNCRSVYVLMNESGRTVGVFNGGYYGYQDVPDAFQDKASRAETFSTTPKEYKTLKSQAAWFTKYGQFKAAVK